MGKNSSRAWLFLAVGLIVCFALFFLFVKSAGIPMQNTPANIPHPTLTIQPSPMPTPTPAMKGSFIIAARLSVNAGSSYDYSYGDYKVSFSQVTDLGDRVGGKENFSDIFQINPEFQGSHHLIGIFVTANPGAGKRLIWRSILFSQVGNQITQRKLAYLLDASGNRYDWGIDCDKSLESCGGIGDTTKLGYAVFEQPATFVMVFAVPNDLNEFTLYTTWEYDSGN